MKLDLLLLIIPYVLIHNDLALHEVKEPSAVLLRRNRRNKGSIINYRLIVIFCHFIQVKILKVIYYSYVVNIFAALTHKRVSRTSSVEKLIIQLFIYRFQAFRVCIVSESLPSNCFLLVLLIVLYVFIYVIFFGSQ